MSNDKSWEISDADGLRLLDILEGDLSNPAFSASTLHPAEDVGEALEMIGYWQHDPTRARRRLLLEEVLIHSPSPRLRYSASSGLAYIRDPLSLHFVRQAAEKETIDDVKASLLHLIEYLESAPDITDTSAAAARHKANLTSRLSALQPAMQEAEALKKELAEIRRAEMESERRELIGTCWMAGAPEHRDVGDKTRWWRYYRINKLESGIPCGLEFEHAYDSTWSVMPDKALIHNEKSIQITDADFLNQFSHMLLAISTLVELPRTFEQRVAGAGRERGC